VSAGGASPLHGWGPEHRRAAVAVTFDNLGEAADLERGRWPKEERLGRHPSVARALPRVLGLLSDLDLPATFFVEGINAQLYPEALAAIVAAGHEIAYHGWRHELWAELDSAREHDLLERGLRALGKVGIRPVGFRPPGGVLASSSLRTLAQTGFTYCSPAGEEVGLCDGLAILPFRWPLIDAFHYLPHFAERRRAAIDSPDALPPSSLRANLAEALEDAMRRGSFLALLFHPFLADADDRVDAVRAVLADLRASVDDGAVWCVPMRDIAGWVQRRH
jgi:peptidoglycan/xylan/chitin deacetylase (PgdA/CDA1 family)